MTPIDKLRNAILRFSRLARRGGRKQADVALRIGNRAASEGDMALAIAAYQMASSLDPARSGPALKLANTLKDIGATDEAIVRYREIIDKNGPKASTLIHLGHALRQVGKSADAIESFTQALELDENSREARYMLLIMGANGRVAKTLSGPDVMQSDLLRLETSLQNVMSALNQRNANSTYPRGAWNAFKRDFPITDAPLVAAKKYLVIVDASVGHPALLRRTLLSLIDQSADNWTAIIVGMSDNSHSVTSFQRTDERIKFQNDFDGLLGSVHAESYDVVVSIAAGTILDDRALSWLGWGLSQTGAELLYCDHDRLREQWSCGRIYSDPTLYGMADPVLMEAKSQMPLLLAGSCKIFDELARSYLEVVEGGRADINYVHYKLLKSRIGICPVPHIPLSLASKLILPDAASLIESSETIRPTRILERDEQVLDLPVTVIIPTKDQSSMLVECIESLYARSKSRARLEVIVVDNRSDLPETQVAIDRMKRIYGIKTIRDDAGFNWSLLNNTASSGVQEGIVVFCNNDTVMLSDGWDDQLRRIFSDPNVGVIGARLWYPDDQQQHAGIVLGFDNGAPKHEGLFSPRSDNGPNERWSCRRGAAAVTGAFLAVPAQLFHKTGGFDEVSLPIGYNDVDFCLRVRELGYIVVYDPEIELIHRESKTRGLNDTQAKIAWDEGELFELRRRWGRAVVEDPFVSPIWSRHIHSPLGGYAKPNFRAMVDYVERSNKSRPWSLKRVENGLFNDEAADTPL
ncbi:glycosyltransferase [Brevundimonas sp. TWP1-2-1b1]|uniref:glycosyltransferase n=1 Tax=unclassified Brevundimonas TaxID=2622653 RepID=UPI003CEEAB5D